MLGLTSMFAQLFERVKVYRLNDGGKWDDKGTGHVSLEYLERSEAVGLVVIDEENNHTLLVHHISADDIYRRQEDTIISWTDPQVATDLALSFQETMSCTYIWDSICNVQRSIQFPSVGGLDSVSRPTRENVEYSDVSQDDDHVIRDWGRGSSGLPPVELGTLPQVVKVVAEVLHFDRDRVAALILRDPNYLQKIVDLFKLCEDLENLDGLHMLFKIVKGIISLNDGHIFDEIFSEEYIMDIVGALEYDPERPAKQKHRAFLNEQVMYKEVIPIRDPNILAKIHQNYRIGFIKDVILPSVLDDQTFATFNSIMLFNNVAVVSALQNDQAFISELFLRLWSPKIAESNRRDLMLFLQEFCNLSKHLQPVLRNQLLRALVKEGLFEILTDALEDSDESVRLSGSDILVVVSNHSPPLLRSFLVEKQGQSLFRVLVKGMVTPGEGGLQSQLVDIMRLLLDSDTMDPAQTDKFLDVFYEKYIDQLVEVVTAGFPLKGTSTDQDKQSTSVQDVPVLKSEISPEILMSICELLCFCVLHHRYRIKYYVMRNNVVEKILRLTYRKEKYLVVAAIRFLRTCIALQDEFYNRYLVKNNLFQPVMQSFLGNGNRYNLLSSAVLELLNYIAKANITLLIVHLVETFSGMFDSLAYGDVFQALRMRYEQSVKGGSAGFGEASRNSIRADEESPSEENPLNEERPFLDLRKRKDERALDKDEEEYFNDDSDEEDTTLAYGSSHCPRPPPVTGNGSALGDLSFRPFGLVDYEDEDEDASSGLKNDEISMDRKFEGVLFPALPTSEVLPDSKGISLKRRVTDRKSETVEDASAVKRRRPESDDGGSQSGLVVELEVEGLTKQAQHVKVSTSDRGEGDKSKVSDEYSESGTVQRTENIDKKLKLQGERCNERMKQQPAEGTSCGPFAIATAKVGDLESTRHNFPVESEGTSVAESLQSNPEEVVPFPKSETLQLRSCCKSDQPADESRENSVPWFPDISTTSHLAKESNSACEASLDTDAEMTALGKSVRPENGHELEYGEPLDASAGLSIQGDVKPCVGFMSVESSDVRSPRETTMGL